MIPSDVHCFWLILFHFQPFSPFWQIIWTVKVVFGLTTFQLLSYINWVIPLIQCGFIWRNADSWVIDYTVFGSFDQFSLFMTNYRLCWGCLWSYNISGTIIHHFWVIPLIQCGFIWLNADSWVITLFSGSFWPILTHFRFLWLIIGFVELVFGLTTFLLLSPTISKWYHPFNLVLCYQMGRRVNF